jgi:hypothetical protein
MASRRAQARELLVGQATPVVSLFAHRRERLTPRASPNQWQKRSRGRAGKPWRPSLHRWLRFLPPHEVIA